MLPEVGEKMPQHMDVMDSYCVCLVFMFGDAVKRRLWVPTDRPLPDCLLRYIFWSRRKIVLEKEKTPVDSALTADRVEIMHVDAGKHPFSCKRDHARAIYARTAHVRHQAFFVWCSFGLGMPVSRLRYELGLPPLFSSCCYFAHLPSVRIPYPRTPCFT